MRKTPQQKIKPSHSALEQFLFCERQFWFRRVAKLPERPSHYLAIGNFYHECIATLLKTGEVDIEAVLQTCKQTPGWISPTPDDLLIKEVITNLERLKTDVFTFIRPKAIEIWSRNIFLAKLDCISSTTPIVKDGKITGTEPQCCIIDWKTSFSQPKRTQASAHNSQQLALYAIEAGVKSAAFVEIPRDPRYSINTIVVRYRADELQAWQDYLSGQFEAMWSRGAEPAAYRLAEKGHPLCSSEWCPYWEHCQAGQKIPEK